MTGKLPPVSELAQGVAAETRGSALRRGLAALGGIVGGGTLLAWLPEAARSARGPAQDVRILNFVHLLESLEDAFYREALKRGKLRGDMRDFARIVGRHESAHVAFLKGTLGKKARKIPSFDFGDATGSRHRFATTAILLEDTGVYAYNGQATSLTQDALRAAARIVSVEARHAAWIRALAGRSPAVDATDALLTEAQVMKRIRKTGFIKS